MCVFRGRTNSVTYKRPFDGTGIVSNLAKTLERGNCPHPLPVPSGLLY